MMTAARGSQRVDRAMPGIPAREHGWRYELMPLSLGRWRIILTDGANVSGGW